MLNKRLVLTLYICLAAAYPAFAEASLSRTVHKIVPAKGIGMHYDFSETVAGDFAYSRNQPVEDGSFKADAATVGLTYSFD
jgi:hypothetical protein